LNKSSFSAHASADVRNVSQATRVNERAVWSTHPDAVQKSGPKSPLSPSVGELCPLCNKAFKAGDFTALISVTSEALKGRYSNRSVEVHWECAQYDAAR
jgi:hypothetical protein